MIKRVLVLLIALNVMGAKTFAQTIYKFGTNGGPSGSGTTLAATSDLSSKTVTFTDASTNALTGITASIFLNGQQYGPGTIQGVPGASGICFGNSNNFTSDNNFSSVPYYRGMNSVSDATNAMFTGCSTCTGGIAVNADQAISLAATTDGFINNKGDNLKAPNDRIYMGNLVINFNVPVSNPILNFVGLGADYEWQENTNHKDYILGFSTEFDLATTNVSLSKKSGNAAFAVTSTSITNASAAIGSSSVGSTLYADPAVRYAASGSVLVSGTNITSIIFFVYLKGDGGRIVNQNNGSTTTANTPFHVAWSASDDATASPFKEAATSVDVFMLGISFQKPVNVSGTVFNDPNDGNVNNSSGSTNAVPGGMYINLIDANNIVVASVPVNPDGTYNFTNIGDGNYTTVLSANDLAQGTSKVASTTPSGWVSTGEYNGAPNTGNDGTVNGNSNVFLVGNTDVANVNFGIEQLPESAVHIRPAMLNPGGTTFVTIPASSFVTSNVGSNPNTQDYSGGFITAIKLTSFPVNTTAIKIDGVSYTTLTAITTAYPNGIPTDASGNPAVTIEVDPANTLGSVVINFSSIDNAGQQDPTPGKVTLPFNGALAIKLIDFTGTLKNGSCILNWITSNELSMDKYEIEFSNNGSVFTTAGEISATNSSLINYYNFIYPVATTGNNYFRIKSLELNGKFEYSNIVTIKNSTAMPYSIYPNPVTTGNVFITGLHGGELIKVTDITGRIVLQDKITGNHIDLSKMKKGFYLLQIIDSKEKISVFKMTLQ